MTEDSTETLKPCPTPWCERKRPPTVVSFTHKPDSWIECSSCDLETPVCPSKAEAITLWNTRIPTSTTGEADPWAGNPAREGMQHNLSTRDTEATRLLREARSVLAMLAEEAELTTREAAKVIGTTRRIDTLIAGKGED